MKQKKKNSWNSIQQLEMVQKVQQNKWNALLYLHIVVWDRF